MHLKSELEGAKYSRHPFRRPPGDYVYGLVLGRCLLLVQAGLKQRPALSWRLAE